MSPTAPITPLALPQPSKTRAQRRAGGEHYTTAEVIRWVLDPMFLDGLRADLATAGDDPSALRALHTRLRAIRVVDPACGAGNFLVIAHHDLRAVEDALRDRLAILAPAAEAALPPAVTPRHFIGIEIGPDAAASARGALPGAVIHEGDALLSDWAALIPHEPGVMTYVVGNPPYLGKISRSREQNEALRAVWGRDFVGNLDYATGWHARAMGFLSDRAGEFAYVTTNSITQGESVSALFGALYREGWDIGFARRSFPWTADGGDVAAVHCVIVGFTRHPGAAAPTACDVRQRLFQGRAQIPLRRGINAYLADGPRILVPKRALPLSPELGPASAGSYPKDGGHLLVTPREYDTVAADPIAVTYLRPFLGAQDLIHAKQRWCLWLNDAPPADLEASPVLRDRIAKVRQMRLASTKPATRALAATSHLFGEPHQPLTPYLCIPGTAGERRAFYPAASLPAEVVTSSGNFTVPDPDGFAFAIVSSTMFLTWQRAVGRRLKSDLSFSTTIVWHNLPLPALTPATRDRIIEAGRRVLAARALHPERSLAEHYRPGQMSPDLLAAHAALDEIVDHAFGADHPPAEEADRQAALFDRYTELSGPERAA